MYCPVDGDEFVEGVTRCPEHDVDLVEEPPELRRQRSPKTSSTTSVRRGRCEQLGASWFRQRLSMPSVAY